MQFLVEVAGQLTLIETRPRRTMTTLPLIVSGVVDRTGLGGAPAGGTPAGG
jgi:hypothetical protein